MTKNFQNAIEKRVFDIFWRVRVRLKAEDPYFTIHNEKNEKYLKKKFCSVFSEKSWFQTGIRPKFSNKCCFLATNVENINPKHFCIFPCKEIFLNQFKGSGPSVIGGGSSVFFSFWPRSRNRCNENFPNQKQSKATRNYGFVFQFTNIMASSWVNSPP